MCPCQGKVPPGPGGDAALSDPSARPDRLKGKGRGDAGRPGTAATPDAWALARRRDVHVPGHPRPQSRSQTTRRPSPGSGPSGEAWRVTQAQLALQSSPASQVPLLPSAPEQGGPNARRPRRTTYPARPVGPWALAPRPETRRRPPGLNQ